MFTKSGGILGNTLIYLVNEPPHFVGVSPCIDPLVLESSSLYCVYAGKHVLISRNCVKKREGMVFGWRN